MATLQQLQSQLADVNCRLRMVAEGRQIQDRYFGDEKCIADGVGAAAKARMDSYEGELNSQKADLEQQIAALGG